MVMWRDTVNCHFETHRNWTCCTFSLLKCSLYYFPPIKAHDIFYYKTLGKATFEIRDLKGHTCTDYRHGTSEESADRLTHHSAQMKPGLGFFALDAGPGCQQGPMEGFLLLTPGVWSLCSKVESTAWFCLQAQCSRH